MWRRRETAEAAQPATASIAAASESRAELRPRRDAARCLREELQ